MKSIYNPSLVDKIPPKLKEPMSMIISFMRQRYSAKCMIVGGALRDMLLDRDVKDLDMECYGIDEVDFHRAMEKLGADGVGKSFFVYKIGDIDIALPRLEKKVGVGHKGFSVEVAKDEQEASRRRDFTINAMLYNPINGYIHDYWGGLEDLEARVLRAVDKNTFIEDSLRVLRAMQFSARLGFKIDRDTSKLCQDISLLDLSKSRIFNEFNKMFKGSYPHYGLYALESMRISQKLCQGSLGRDRFIKCALDMARYIKSDENSDIKDSYFLAIYSQYSSTDIETILKAIDAPNRYFKLFKNFPKLPKNITNSFVASLAHKAGVKDHPLSYHPIIREKAKKLGVWDRAFDIGVTPKELISIGYSGKELGDKLKEIRLERLRELDKII